MGHIRLGRLPSSKSWKKVVALLDDQADLGAIAVQSAEAAETDLRSAADDPGLVYSFWLLSQLPIAARQPDYVDQLRRLGFQVSKNPSLLEIAGAFSRAVDEHVRATGGRTDLGEMSQNAAVESLTTLVGRDLPGLFGPTAQDVQGALHRLGTTERFSVLARDFFSRVARKSLGYFLSRELSSHVGPGKAFASIRDHTAFNEALDVHCREASRIIKEFAGGWYGKTLFIEKEISPQRAAGFTHVAFKKLLSELSKRNDADG